MEIESVFEAAIQVASPEARAEYLRRACGGDASALATLEKLVAAHFQAGDFLESPAPGLATAVIDRLGPGSVIGPYTLVEQLGEGGMGVVFRAEQARPVKRQVALKVIKLGMDSRQVLARFDAERQALAILDHPNVAKVYDAGVTDEGRPYFVMELVSGGVSITDYCDRHLLDVPRRLELFTQVCRALQHAHQKGLIHRDLKPSNVLVVTQDDEPVVKVIDFGVAKATKYQLTERTLYTDLHQLVGTPQYMSPEQAEGIADVDTRSDVYSLGVLLYELLAGAPPFDGRELRSKAYAEMHRIIREVDPPPPSTRLSRLDSLASVAARRATEPRRLAATLRGELDWIVMKALEKDRSRRYESASALAADVARHLSDEPVLAGPPSRAYRARKFVRRHRAAVLTASAVALLLSGGTTGTTIGLLQARKQRAQAQRQEAQAREQTAIAEAVSKFQSDMLASADPHKLMGENVSVLQAVSAAVKELDGGKLKDRPLVEAQVRDTIGNTLRELGRFDLAEPNLRTAVELRRRHLPPGSRPIAQSLENLAVLLQWQRKFDESESMHREAISIFRSLDPPDEENVATALNNLGWLMVAQEKYAQAEKFATEALAVYRRTLPQDHASISVALSNVAHILVRERKFAEAEPMAAEALSALRKTLPAGHPNLAAALSTMAAVQHEQGKNAQAEPYFRESLQIFRSSLPADHPNLAVAANSLGVTLRAQGKFAEAEPLFREACAIRRKSLPPTSFAIADSLYNLAQTLADQSRYAQAEPVFRDAIGAGEKAVGKEAVIVGRIRMSLGNALARSSQFAEAETELLEAHRVFSNSPTAAENLGKCAQAIRTLYDRWDKAEPGKGYDLKARQWQDKLAKPSTTTKSTEP